MGDTVRPIKVAVEPQERVRLADMEIQLRLEGRTVYANVLEKLIERYDKAEKRRK